MTACHCGRGVLSIFIAVTVLSAKQGESLYTYFTCWSYWGILYARRVAVKGLAVLQ